MCRLQRLHVFQGPQRAAGASPDFALWLERRILRPRRAGQHEGRKHSTATVTKKPIPLALLRLITLLS